MQMLHQCFIEILIKTYLMFVYNFIKLLKKNIEIMNENFMKCEIFSLKNLIYGYYKYSN